MQFQIRQALKADMPGVLALIKALALYEKEPEQVEITLQDLERDGFEVQPKFTCFVVEINQEVVAMALVYFRYSTWKGQVLHLEDLVVAAPYRGKGIGSALLDHVVQYAKSQGVKRVGWEVLDWNTPAISLYEKKGANVMRHWHVVQLNEQAIEAYLLNIES